MTKAKPIAKKKTTAGRTKKKSEVVRQVHAELVDDAAEFRPAPTPDDNDDDLVLSSTIPLTEEKGLAPADPVAAYMAQVRKYPLLTPEEERELALRYFESGDPKAAEKLVTANLRFVVKVAAEYARFGVRLIDLIQEGNVGLMQAVKDFNPHKGVRLITYAVWWIRGYIQDYLMRQYSMVRIGTTQTQRRLFYQLQKHKAELEAMGRAEGLKLLGSRLGVSEEEIETMQQRLQGRDVSLNAPLDDENSTSLMDFQSAQQVAPADEVLEHQELLNMLRHHVEELRPTLNHKELVILEERLLSDEPLTLQEIGEKYGITREAVRQTEVRLLKKLRDRF